MVRGRHASQLHVMRFIWDKIQIRRAKGSQNYVLKGELAFDPNRHLIYTMLRRRRSLPGGSDGEMNSSQNEPIKRDKDEAERMKKERMAKLKMV